MPEHPFPSKSLRVAVAQAQAAAGDIDANVDTVVKMIRETGSRDVDLVLFPEKFLSGYEPDLVASEPGRYSFRIGDDRPRPHPEGMP